eukprot:3116123-Amphidinium_carterae.1
MDIRLKGEIKFTGITFHTFAATRGTASKTLPSSLTLFHFVRKYVIVAIISRCSAWYPCGIAAVLKGVQTTQGTRGPWF